jgi:hypothetical protein
MLRKLIGAAAIVVLFAGLAHAQYTGPLPNSGFDDGRFNMNMWPAIGRSHAPEDAWREYEIERQYQETLRTKIPDRKPSNDPWRKIRSAPTALPVDRHRVE